MDKRIADTVRSVMAAERQNKSWRDNPVVVAALSAFSTLLVAWVIWSLNQAGAVPDSNLKALSEQLKSVEMKLDTVISDSNIVGNRVTALEAQINIIEGQIAVFNAAGPRFSQEDGARLRDELRDEIRRHHP